MSEHILKVEKDLAKLSMLTSISVPKDKIFFIKDVENIIRRSMEYKDFIKYLKFERNLTKCGFLNIDNSIKKLRKISIEYHHHPFTLFDIVQLVLEREIENNPGSTAFNEYYLANDVMELHASNMVGMVPLTKTIHQAFHAGMITIPKSEVYGDVDAFYNKYHRFMDDVLSNKYAFYNSTDNMSIFDFENNRTVLTVNKQIIETVGTLPINKISSIDNNNIEFLE